MLPLPDEQAPVASLVDNRPAGAGHGSAGCWLVGSRALLQPQLDIQMHNTYFLIPPYWLVLALMLPLALLAWLVRRLSGWLR